MLGWSAQGCHGHLISGVCLEEAGPPHSPHGEKHHYNSPFRFFPWPPALGQALSCPVLWAPGELGDLLLGAEQDEIDKHRQDLCSVLCACGDGGMARGLPRTQSGSSQKGGCSCPGRGQGRDGALGRGPAGAKTWGFIKGQRTADPGERLCIQGAQDLGRRLRAALQQRDVGPPAVGRGGFGGEGRGWAPGLCGFWGSLSSRKGSVCQGPPSSEKWHQEAERRALWARGFCAGFPAFLP